MTSSTDVSLVRRGNLDSALSITLLAGWAILLCMEWALAREAAFPLVVGTLVASVTVLFLTRPVVVLYVLIALGPFYDLARAFLFPGAELLGFWQDLLIAFLWIGALRKVLRYGLPKLNWVDRFAIGFVGFYALSILASSNARVWFYGFRWFVLCPLMYLALRTFTFTENQRRRILGLIAGSLVVSGIVGLIGMKYLGWDAAVELYQSVNLEIFTRNDVWRWAATFSNPIIASSAFSLLFLIFACASYYYKRRVVMLLGCAFAGVCVYLTHSRTGVVVSAVGLLTILFAVRSRHAKKLLVGTVVAAAVLGVQVVQTFDEWDALRLQQFTRTITEAITVYPFGTGAGTAGAVSMAAASFAGQNGSAVDTVVGDSVVLTVLRDTGWLGAICYLGACFSVIAMTWRARNSLVGLVALGLWAGSFVNLMNATDVYPTRLYLWLLAAMAGAHATQER